VRSLAEKRQIDRMRQYRAEKSSARPPRLDADTVARIRGRKPGGVLVKAPQRKKP
jgi:hypothetical protein